MIYNAIKKKISKLKYFSNLVFFREQLNLYSEQKNMKSKLCKLQEKKRQLEMSIQELSRLVSTFCIAFHYLEGLSLKL